MAEIKWSPEQQKIIESRGKNLLVSAAAGAGKTTVMVERILGMIAGKDSTTDIDNLLIVTFTKDAASNMREKLSGRISKMLEEDPGNRRLIRQQMLLRNAQITTIDSFCNSVVKEFYYRTDIDPNFRIADSAEIALVRKKVLEDLLEEKYEQADAGFVNMVECFCPSKNDEVISELIEKLSNAACAQAWPAQWLDDLKCDLMLDRQNTDLRKEWKDQIAAFCSEMIADAAERACDAVKIASEEGRKLLLESANSADERKVSKAMDILNSERSVLERLKKENSYETLRETLKNISFDRLTMFNCSEEAKEAVAGNRNAYKEIIKKINEKWFAQPQEEQAKACAEASGPLTELVKLTREFMTRLLEVKKENSIFEFSDISHFALEILTVRDENGKTGPSEAALELRSRFREIFIDEYQDSDAVQEKIAETVSGSPDILPCLFVVGDVKQSIYRFRMARPELFINRERRYTNDLIEGELVRLGYNYRSEEQVVNSVNDLFRLCMHENTGKIEYDKDSELVCGKAVLRKEKGEEAKPVTEEDITELLLAVDEEADEEADEQGITESTEELTASEACAKIAAKRICDLVEKKYQIIDEKRGTRNIEYGDIAVLLRSGGSAAECYRKAFEEAGIPAFAQSGHGFLYSYEISVVIAYLKLLDNPYQDIPLAAVLRSPIGGFDEDDMAALRILGGIRVPFWQCLKEYAEHGTNETIKQKATAFLGLYDEIRRMNLTREIDKVIMAICEKTGFYLYCSALPAGDMRASNLNQLMTYASEFESGSYSGLYDFVGYIEQITKAEDDLDEAVSTEAANAVRIMTIHKSKGLEFPVVIIGDAGKQFNMNDKRQEVIISPDYGIATKCILPEIRSKKNTIRRQIMAELIEQDTIGEELRILYVAMTRAMQKLIVIGKETKSRKKKEEWEKIASDPSQAYPDGYIADADGYMDLIYPAAVKNPEDFIIRHININETGGTVPESSLNNKSTYMALASGETVFSEDVEIKSELAYKYGFDTADELPIKLSVSDIKHAGMEEEGVDTPWRSKGGEKKERTGMSGAELGTLYHKIMQFIPFDLKDEKETTEFLDHMAGRTDAESCGNLRSYAIITEEERNALNPSVIAGFLRTHLCERMRKADSMGLLSREQPFIMGIEACRVDPVRFAQRHELIPVQGIIDCMFEEDDGFVILDYKTDKVDQDHEEELIKRYHNQLALYADAVSEILQKKVKERIIYSFSLGRCISLDAG